MKLRFLSLFLFPFTLFVVGCAPPSLGKMFILEECPPKKGCIFQYDSGVGIHGGNVDKFTGFVYADKDGNQNVKVFHDSSALGTLQTSIPSIVGAAGNIATGTIVSRNQRLAAERSSANMAGAAVAVADRQSAALIGAANIAGNTARDVAMINSDTSRYAVDHAPEGSITTFNMYGGAGGQGGQAIGVGQGGNGYGGSGTAIAGTETNVGVGINTDQQHGGQHQGGGGGCQDCD